MLYLPKRRYLFYFAFRLKGNAKFILQRQPFSYGAILFCTVLISKADWIFDESFAAG